MNDYEMTVLLSGVVGSTAYGLDHEGSDIDRMGIFTWPTQAFHGLTEPPDYREKKSDVVDQSLFEARKFLGLALNGNPTVSELLWLPEYEQSSPWGESLVDIRRSFLSAPRVKDAYLGYARQQFYKLGETGTFSSSLRNRREKHARHLRRLVEQGYQLYTTGDLTLRVANPEEVMEFGRSVAEDSSSADEYMAKAVERFEDAKSVLPSQPNTKHAEQWLQRLRKDFYR